MTGTAQSEAATAALEQSEAATAAREQSEAATAALEQSDYDNYLKQFKQQYAIISADKAKNTYCIACESHLCKQTMEETQKSWRRLRDQSHMNKANKQRNRQSRRTSTLYAKKGWLL